MFSKTAELFEITQDQNCTDPSWAKKEESIPALLRELTVSSRSNHFNMGFNFNVLASSGPFHLYVEGALASICRSKNKSEKGNSVNTLI